jgi:hypothetical protein
VTLIKTIDLAEEEAARGTEEETPDEKALETEIQ